MPFSRPTLTELIDRNQSDINSRLPGADARLRRSILNVLAYINARAGNDVGAYLDFIAKQAIIDTSESEFLERWASIWGIERKAATKSNGMLPITGTNGAIIAAGTLLQRSDGVQFTVTANATIVDGTANLSIHAVEPGSNSNTAPGSALTFISTPAGVNSSGTLTSALTGGTDVESDESLLSRLLARIRRPPHGGNEEDYKQWALAIPGVTRAWVYPKELGIGTVSVRFMMDGTYENGIPEPDDVKLVQAYIDAARPVTAEVFVVAPIPDTLNFNIHLNLQDTSATRAAVEAELKDMVRRDAEPGGTIYLSRINEAISVADGEFDHTLISPAANVTHTTGHIAVFGAITWS